MRRCGNDFSGDCNSYCGLRHFGKEEKEMMTNISFIAILIGAAGIAGGIETDSGIVTSVVVFLLGIIGMPIALYREKKNQG